MQSWSMLPAVLSTATIAVCGNHSQFFSSDFWACFLFPTVSRLTSFAFLFLQRGGESNDWGF